MDPTEIKQRTDEWKNIDHAALRYHIDQWDTPKRSTEAFEYFASKYIEKTNHILDLGCGAGAATAYLAKKNPNVLFTGYDYSNELINIGNDIAKAKNINNVSFKENNLFNLNKEDQFDGVISLQTLSWLPEFEAPLVEIFRKISPKWLGITSLFYEGDITCRTEVEEHKRNRKVFYNTYSLPSITRLCKSEGYTLKTATPFMIDIDIIRPANIDEIGTYTKRTIGENNSIERLQISGPMLLNWYMLLIEKSQ